MVQTADKFGSYYPTITADLVKQGINSILSVCAVSDGKSLSGEYRVALGSKTPLRIPLDLELVLGCNPIPEVQFYYPVQANNLRFMNNRWHTEWYSFQDLLSAGLLACDKAKTSKESYAKLVDRCKLSLIKEEFQCAFRIEVGCPSDGDVLDLNIRWLPCSAHYLKNHSRLNSGDVATINGGSVNIHCPSFPEPLRDVMHHFPVPPTLFIDSDLTLDDYSIAVLDGFPAILSFIKGHVDLTIENAREYIKSPTAHSGNVQRFKPKRKNPPTSTSELAAQSHATGTFTLSKFGTKKNIWQYIACIPYAQRKKISLSKSGSTWDSYMTAWRTFTNFCIIKRRKPYIPVEPDILIDYVCFLDEDRGLQYPTVRSYLSALKKLHHLNNVSDKSFDCPRLSDVLKGIYNESTLMKSVSTKKYRAVMTWTVMKILGMKIWGSAGMTDFNKQVFWTISLFCFFGAFRGGEMMSLDANSFDPFRCITWAKIKRLNQNQLLIDLVVPKSSEVPEGTVVDIFRYPGDKSMCPIENIDFLIKMVLKLRGLDLNKPVFQFDNGSMMTPKFMNEKLNEFLKPLFPNVQFSSHSFRAGIPSHMAANPELFSVEDSMIGGRWTSNTVKRYQRLHGAAQRNIFSKFHNFLQVQI